MRVIVGVNKQYVRPRFISVGCMGTKRRRQHDGYDKCNEKGDEVRMADLDSGFQREQLLLEVLLDVRDAIYGIAENKTNESALEKLSALRKLTRL